MREEQGRFLTEADFDRPRPTYAVWEITLACDLKCNHCGSRALKPRPDELNTDEAIDMGSQLAAAGCREISIIGGEAYLRKDWTTIVASIREHGMKPTMQTGGRNFTEKRAEEGAKAGLQEVGVSIDGMKDLHDELRGVAGSWDKTFETIERCQRHDIGVGVNTQVGARTIGDLRPLMHELINAGVKAWRLQLTVAMGRAADNAELLLQPYKIPELFDHIIELYDEAAQYGMTVQLGNNMGYFGPYEARLRTAENSTNHWFGCQAGLTAIGIEADGTIKGCPSLPTQPYAGANIRDVDLQTIWDTAPGLTFNRERTREDLWGHCKTCYYADVCKAGCTWTTHTLLGKPGNNPYCHYRAIELAKKGVRERIAKVKDADGRPFDYAGFELIEEPLDAPEPQAVDNRPAGHRRLTVLA